MTRKLIDLPDSVREAQLAFGFVDHFLCKDADFWTTVATDSGTATVSAGKGGYLALAPSDGSVADNDEVYVHTAEVFNFVSGCPIEFGATIKYTEANTDDANVFVGLADGVAANLLQDNGAGPKASGSLVGFYKVDGGTNWNIIYSDDSTQTTVELTALNSLTNEAVTSGGGVDQLLEVQVYFGAGSRLEVVFKVDDEDVYKLTDQTFANATEMSFVMGAKNGSVNNESITFDQVYAYQRS